MAMDDGHLIERLAWLRDVPDGVLHRGPAGPLQALVIKRTGQVGLYFENPSGALDGPMSRVDPARPLHLLAEYTQALTLGLLWSPDPQRIGVLGLGGGRLSLVLGHHLPRATIDSVDIDPVLAELAERFFGFVAGAQQRVAINDARAFLADSSDGPRYDLLVMDAFSDQSDNLEHLATVEFYALCRAQIRRGGTLALNMLRSDTQLAGKTAALAASFPEILVVPLKHSLVLFGATQAGRLPLRQVEPRAAALQRRLGFDFPFVERAAELRIFRPGEFGLAGAAPLTDQGR
jgi:spermidine synthase